MVNWFVGLRIRLVVSKNEFNRGREGVIRAIGHWRYGDILPCGFPYGSSVPSDLYVEWDSVVEADGVYNDVGPVQSYRVEPILPDGAQPLGYSFEQMMSEFGVTEAVK